MFNLIRITVHREKYSKWGKEFCLEYFGGGLTKFLRELVDEKFIYPNVNLQM